MIDRSVSGKRWLKAELHAHCSQDPTDYRVIRHSPEELLARAAETGYDVLAVTCHNRDIWTRDLAERARDLGVTLIPGMEVSAEGGRHVLVYNYRTGPENLNTLDKVRSLSRDDTMVIAPHPYYPGPLCLRKLLRRHADVFDAVEYSGFRVRGMDFNRRVAAFARESGKPLVGFGDIHFLWQLNRTYTWIYAEPDIGSIIDAVKCGQVRMESSPLSWKEAAAWWGTSLWRCAFPVNTAPTVEGDTAPA